LIRGSVLKFHRESKARASGAYLPVWPQPAMPRWLNSVFLSSVVRGRLTGRAGLRVSARKSKLRSHGKSRLPAALARKGEQEMNEHHPAHVSVFIASPSVEYSILLPIIKEGIANGERVFEILDPRKADQHIRHVEEAGIDVGTEQRRGQLVFKDWSEAHLKGGSFAVQRMLDFIANALSDPGDATSTRLIGNMDWILNHPPGAENVLEFEARLNDLVLKREAIVYCQYDLTRLSDAFMLNVARTHPMVQLGEPRRNPLFLPSDDFLEQLGQGYIDRSPSPLRS
jgi:hypothetical protein